MNYIQDLLNSFTSRLPLHDPLFVKIMLGILSVSIFTMVIGIMFIIFQLRDQRNIIAKLKKFNENLVEEAFKEVSKRQTTKSFYDHIDLLLSRSQIKYNFYFNFWTFIIVTILFFLFGLYSFMDVTENYLTSLLAGIGFGFIPYVFLEVIASIKGRQIKNQILTLIPILINNAKLTSGDVFLTIKKSIPKTKEPMRIYLDEFVEEYESGLKIDRCFENLKNKVMDYRFTRLVDALENHLYKGGSVAVTLGSIQKEYLAREIEEDRRKKEYYANVLGVYIAVAANIGIVYEISKVMPEIITELKGPDYKYNILFAVLTILISLFIAFKSTRIGNQSK